MSVPLATKGINRGYINRYLKHPTWPRAKRSKVVRKYLDKHGYVTPNFSWAEMADSKGVPVPANLRKNTIRHCWNLEGFAHDLALHDKRRPKPDRIGIAVDGPYRTPDHNKEVGGAPDSQHMQGDASDHFVIQVKHWESVTGLSFAQIVTIARRHFTAIGTETSGTLHFDSRPGAKGSINFVNWTHS